MKRRISGFGRSVKVFLFRDYVRKLVALALALVLYGYVHESKTRQVGNVPVELQLPQNMVNVSEDFPRRVMLTVRSSEWMLNRLSPEDIHGVINAHLYEEGEHEVKLLNSMFKVPYGVTVEKAEPEKISFKLEKVISRSVPIRQVFDSEDKLPAGYTIRSVKVIPEDVVITGPVSIVKPLSQVLTEPVPVDGTSRESFDFVARLQTFAGGVSMTPDQVTMRVEIDRKEFSERTMGALPYSLFMTQRQRQLWSVEPVPGTPMLVNAVVRGPGGSLMDLDKKAVRIFADISDIPNPGEYTLDLKWTFLKNDKTNFEIIRIEPDKIQVTVRPLPSNTKKDSAENGI